MATVYEWLKAEGFDFAQGRIIYHPTDSPSPGRCDRDGDPILMPGAVLHQYFHSGYGAPKCPRFVAEDPIAIYFPSQYDGSTSLEKVYKNLDVYLTGNEETPYPGG